MKPVLFQDAFMIPVPRDRIYRRLGYRKGKTRLTDSQSEETELQIQDAVSHIRLRGAGIRIPVQEKRERETVLLFGSMSEGLGERPGEFAVPSAGIAQMLAGSEEVLLVAATAGPDIMEAIRKDSACNNLTRAVVMDAVAGEMVDSALNWIIRYFNHELSRENKRVTKKRFSAGYGDFPLNNQEWIYKALSLELLGVGLTQSFMLVPEKTVTAVCGIEKIEN